MVINIIIFLFTVCSLIFGEQAVASDTLKGKVLLNAKLTTKERYGIFEYDENPEIEISIQGDKLTAENIIWCIKNYLGVTVEAGIYDVPKSNASFSCKITPKRHGSGYFEFYARLDKTNIILPRKGTRPAGMLTYGVLSEMKALPLKTAENSRFGIQGTTFCKSGKRLSGDGFSPLYDCLGVKWVYIPKRLQNIEPEKGKFIPKTAKGDFKYSYSFYVQNKLLPMWDLHSVPAWLMNSPKPYATSASATHECQKYPPRDFNYYGELIGKVTKEIISANKYRFSYMKKNYYSIHWEPDWYWLGTDEKFIQMYKSAYEAIHAVDTNAILIGANYGVISVGNSNLERVFEKGLGRYLDGIAFHSYYTTQRISPEANGLVENVSEIMQMAHKYLKPGAPVFQTEWGTAWAGDYSKIDVPLYLLQREMAWSMRNHLIILGEGVNSTGFFYTSDFEKNGWGMTYNLDWPDIKYGPVNISPKPVGMALANLTRMLEGTESLGRIDYLGQNILGYIFQRGKETLVAIWSTDEKSRSIILEIGTSSVRVIDCMGNNEHVIPQSGQIELPINSFPKYILGLNKKVLPLKRGNVFLVTNKFSSVAKKINNTEHLVASNVKNNRPIIDGDLKDWFRDSFRQHKSKKDLEFIKAPWQGPVDLSVKYCLQYDRNNLYVAFEVTDQNHCPPLKKDQSWRGDSILLTFGSKPNTRGRFGVKKKISFELDEKGKELVKEYRTPPFPPMLIHVFNNQEIDVKFKRNVQNGVTIYESAIPWTVICGIPFPENDIGMSVMINDADSKDQIVKDARKTMGIAGGDALYDINSELWHIRLGR